MVQREAAQAGLAAGDGQEEFAVADGEVGLKIVHEPGDLADDARGFGHALDGLADHPRHRHPAAAMDGPQHGDLQHAPAALAEGLGHAPAADEAELVLGQQALDDGLRAHDVAVGVAHHAVEDFCHERAGEPSADYAD